MDLFGKERSQAILLISDAERFVVRVEHAVDFIIADDDVLALITDDADDETWLSEVGWVARVESHFCGFERQVITRFEQKVTKATKRRCRAESSRRWVP